MLYVTPSLKAKGPLQAEAAAWAASLGATFVTRQKRTVPELWQAYGEDNLLVYTTQGPVIERPEGRHFFSLNMAELRIQNLRRGEPDHLLEAFGATGPVRLLDCTCGFGADAMVASFGLPAGSTVEALEAIPQMAAVTGWGFTHFVHEKEDVTAALRRISLTCGTYGDYLAQAGQDYDIIYFDPMFQKPVAGSCQFTPVRDLLDHDALTAETIRLALMRAAKVVVKGRFLKELVAAFPQAALHGGRYSRVRYAVIER